MEIKSEDLKKYLLAEFEGKAVGYGVWDVKSKVWHYVDDLAKKAGLNTSLFSTRDDKWSVYITYRRKDIGVVEVKRKKGVHHHSYWGNGYNDWTYKDFAVGFYNEDYNKTLDEYLASIDEQLDKEANHEQRLDDRAKKALELIMKEFSVDKYEARAIAQRIDNKYYTITSGM
jgi:hypothetical protein